MSSYTGDQQIRRIRQILNVFDFSFIANFIKLKPGLKLLKIEFSDLVSFPVDKVRLKSLKFQYFQFDAKVSEVVVNWWCANASTNKGHFKILSPQGS